jgi:hypothetical protein
MTITGLIRINSQDLVIIIIQIITGIHIMTHIGDGIMAGHGILVGISDIVTILGIHHGIIHITDTAIGDTLHTIGVAGTMVTGMVIMMDGMTDIGMETVVITMDMPEMTMVLITVTELLLVEMGHLQQVEFQRQITLV